MLTFAGHGQVLQSLIKSKPISELSAGITMRTIQDIQLNMTDRVRLQWEALLMHIALLRVGQVVKELKDLTPTFSDATLPVGPSVRGGDK